MTDDTDRLFLGKNANELTMDDLLTISQTEGDAAMEAAWQAMNPNRAVRIRAIATVMVKFGEDVRVLIESDPEHADEWTTIISGVLKTAYDAGDRDGRERTMYAAAQATSHIVKELGVDEGTAMKATRRVTKALVAEGDDAINPEYQRGLGS